MNNLNHIPTNPGKNAPIPETDSPWTSANAGPQAVIEEASQESFPASDAPAWTPVTGVGSPPPSATVPEPAGSPHPTARQATLSRGTRDEHDALLVAMHRLEAALAAAAPGREQGWNARVLNDLRGVQEYLDRHVASAEAPDGLLAEIDLTRPTLVRRVDQLRREHTDLLQQAGALQRQVEQLWCVDWTTDPDVRPDVADIRQQAARLLNALRDHQAHETDLIFESFFTDIGAGD